MSLLANIEDKIVQILQKKLGSEPYISSFPANSSSFDPARMRRAVLVHFNSSKYGKVSDLDHSHQFRELQFAILIYCNTLENSSQNYILLDDIRKALQNVILPGATPIQIVSERLVSELHGQWEWQTVISLVVQSVAPEANRPRPAAPLNTFHQQSRS